MARRCATPMALKAALEQRLRSRAAGDGLELQRTRQLVVYDRFLARVFAEYEDAVVLRGGLALELRLERARTTKDVDLRLVGRPDATLRRLQAAGRLDLDDHFRFVVVPDPRTRRSRPRAWSTRDSGSAWRGGWRTRSTVGPSGWTSPSPSRWRGSPTCSSARAGCPSPACRLRGSAAYPLETHIAEKLHAYTMPRRRPNSRVKDLPDLALLGMVRDIDAATLRAAIEQTWAHRGTHPVPSSLPEPPAAWARLYEAMARASRLPWATLEKVTEAARGFLEPVLRGEDGRWVAKSLEWRRR